MDYWWGFMISHLVLSSTSQTLPSLEDRPMTVQKPNLYDGNCLSREVPDFNCIGSTYVHFPTQTQNLPNVHSVQERAEVQRSALTKTQGKNSFMNTHSLLRLYLPSNQGN